MIGLDGRDRTPQEALFAIGGALWWIIKMAFYVVCISIPFLLIAALLKFLILYLF